MVEDMSGLYEMSARIMAAEVINKEKKSKENKHTIKSMNLLVVDDEEEICKMFTKWLSLGTYNVKYTLSGKKAIKLVEKEHFNFVFIDLIMPEMPGIKVIDRINKISPSTKLVVITGKLIDRATLLELQNKGICSLLQKPFKIDQVIEILKSEGTGPTQ